MLLNEWGPLNTWRADAIEEGGGSGGKKPHGAVILPRVELPEDFDYTDEELIAIAIAAIQEFYYH